MGKYIELNQNNMEDTIKEGVSLVDFWAPWCGPCRMISPVIDQLAVEFDGKAKICKVNTEDEPDLTSKYQVRSIPTILFFKNGEIVEQGTHKQLVEIKSEYFNLVKNQLELGN